jgi:glucosylceramidase
MISLNSTRRDFLKTTAFGMAATLAGGGLLRSAFALPQPVSNLNAWITDGRKKLAPVSGIFWRPAGAAHAATVVIREDETFQSILGFGAALTDSSCYVIDQMPSDARGALMHELFHPSRLNLTVCRGAMGASDYATHVYSYDDSATADPGLKHFSIEHDRKYILPVMREARAMNPDFFLFASPWSPPGWMKANGSMLGGSMRKKWLGAYADYFVKFIRAYEAEKVPVRAVTVQNEVDTDQDGRMPACIWPQELEVEFIEKHLGPALRGTGTEIWMLDHNYDLWGRVMSSLEKKGVRKYAKGIAWHGYVGEASMMSRVQKAFPDIGMYWTEGGPNLKKGDMMHDWARWGKTFTEILNNSCRSITSWNLTLDEQGRPNVGPFTCAGMVTVNSKTHELTRSAQYWTMAHFSKYMRPGAVRIGTESSVEDLSHVAVRNADGGKALVLTNTGGARKVSVQAGRQATEIALPGNSVATLAWA